MSLGLCLSDTMAIKRKCICCGKEYEYCPNCHKQLKPLWMNTFDCEDCKDLFNLVSAYNVGMIDKNKVDDFVKVKGLNPMNYVESIRSVIEDRPIYSSETSVKKEDSVSAIENENGTYPSFHYVSRRRRK